MTGRVDPLLPAGARTVPNTPDDPPARRNGHKPHTDPLPHDLTAQAALLGAAMLGNPGAITDVPPDAFYGAQHRTIASAITEMALAGDYVDSVTIGAHLEAAGELDRIGGRSVLALLLADCPATSTEATTPYARLVLEHWRARQLIEGGEALVRAARERGADAAEAILRPLASNIAPAAVDHHDLDLDDFLAQPEDDYDWLVEGLLERGDRVILTGPEGGGKSTLLRQIAIQLASGIDPFTLDDIDPLQVLYVDCENSPRQARRAFRGLRTAAGDSYLNGKLRVRVLGHSIELAKADVMADLGARIDHQAVDVLIIGPLYKLIGDDPLKELPAKAVADAIDWLRNRRGSAVLIEAHSPYAEGHGKTRPTRPYGASLWSRWPEFGIYLGADGKLAHWRGQRDQRTWPTTLERSTPWPWAKGIAAPTWDGPTECITAVVAFLQETDGEYSTKQLGARLRERGTSFRDATIAQAARIAHDRDLIAQRAGPRGAYLYSRLTLDVPDHLPDTWDEF